MESKNALNQVFNEDASGLCRNDTKSKVCCENTVLNANDKNPNVSCSEEILNSSYESALEKIHSLLTFGSRPGLERMKQLLQRMGNPQDKLKYIHIAGTNGKGSVCAMLSATLVSAGYKTGLFISPYITDFRERIQINNQMVEKETLVKAVDETFPLVQQLSDEGIVITEFEYVNALQFYIHSKENCDVVVLETGMGGLLDCTNVIKPPLCSAITVIGLDHTAVLGDTIEKIAFQKCGILKENSIAVTSEQENSAMTVIEKTAKKLKIPLFKSESIKIDVKQTSLFGSVFDYKGCEITLPFAGEHQLKNARTALAVIEALRGSRALEISDKNIADGFAKAVNPARLELICKEPVVLLDGAHNPNGIEALKTALDSLLSGKKVIAIMGMLADKDVESSLELLKGRLYEVCTVPIDNPRALSSQQLAKMCRKHFANVKSFDSVNLAFDSAFEQAKSDKENCAVVVFGSLYLAGQIRPYLLEKR